ncbi:amidohydrolase family protein [Streptomyces sp. DSM 44917]|uniref:Amidohydrolase family protein n=1 Tax=Streptomyces boetiae TaxID=3075541 RepID=A0ABU2L1Y8_9ACTN|nr:amidohydrolase family protein [Streptomyces sp. DSM 44917]MDT0305567.1 amidohydrolase family protein [Streptomyces sp. DSM 44917]
MDLPALVDHHCHGVLREGPEERGAFEALLTEADAPPAPGTSYFDTQLGFAVRRWCAPALGLPAHAPPEAYLARRRALGTAEVTRRLLRAAGIGAFLVDTGLPGPLLGPEELAAAGDGQAREVVRLETLAERAAATADSADAFLGALDEALAQAARTAVAFKSVAAYRHGLHLAPAPPAPAELWPAADRWLSGGDRARLTDPVLLRHLLWSAARTGLPLQLHTGFGDPDLRLHHADPALLTDFLRAVRPTGCRVVLLHGYPYHRTAGYLAAAYPHVYADVGLALSHTGARAEAVLAEMLELTPFGKLLFSTDAYGLPELYLVGSRLFRDALGRVLGTAVAEGAWSPADAPRVAALIASGNARRLYRLGREG